MLYAHFKYSKQNREYRQYNTITHYSLNKTGGRKSRWSHLMDIQVHDEHLPSGGGGVPQVLRGDCEVVEQTEP